MVSTPRAISFFSQVTQFTRQPVVSRPDELTIIEKYMIVDAYLFLKKAALFTHVDPELTLLEYSFLMEAYKEYYELRMIDVEGSQFEEGMKELNKIDRGGVPNF